MLGRRVLNMSDKTFLIRIRNLNKRGSRRAAPHRTITSEVNNLDANENTNWYFSEYNTFQGKWENRVGVQCTYIRDRNERDAGQ